MGREEMVPAASAAAATTGSSSSNSGTASPSPSPSPVSLLRSFFHVQELRATTYTQWERMFTTYLADVSGAREETYTRGCADITREFSSCSQQVIGIVAELESHASQQHELLRQQRARLAQLLRDVQRQEKEKLRLTALLQILRKTQNAELLHTHTAALVAAASPAAIEQAPAAAATARAAARGQHSHEHIHFLPAQGEEEFTGIALNRDASSNNATPNTLADLNTLGDISNGGHGVSDDVKRGVPIDQALALLSARQQCSHDDNHRNHDYRDHASPSGLEEEAAAPAAEAAGGPEWLEGEAGVMQGGGRGGTGGGADHVLGLGTLDGVLGGVEQGIGEGRRAGDQRDTIEGLAWSGAVGDVRRQLGEVVVAINEVLEEVRCELLEMMEEEA